MLKSCSVNDYFQNAPAAPRTFDMYLGGCGPLLVRGPQFENHLLRTPATVKVLFLTCYFFGFGFDHGMDLSIIIRIFNCTL